MRWMQCCANSLHCQIDIFHHFSPRHYTDVQFHSAKCSHLSKHVDRVCTSFRKPPSRRAMFFRPAPSCYPRIQCLGLDLSRFGPEMNLMPPSDFQGMRFGAVWGGKSSFSGMFQRNFRNRRKIFEQGEIRPRESNTDFVGSLMEI